MANPYEIAIHISLENAVSPVLALIAKDMLGLNMSAERLTKAFKEIGTGLKMAVGGAAVAVAGYELGKGIEHVLAKGGELVKQQMLLRNMGGISEAQILHTTSLAQLDTQKIIGTTIAENVKGIREMLGVMPDLQSAQTKYPAVMQIAKVLESLTGQDAEKNLQTIAKGIELRGGGIDPVTRKLSPERFEHEAAAFKAAIVASGGFIDANKLLQFTTMAGPMAKMVADPDVFYRNMITAIMDMGGFRAGTGLTALGRQFLGGKMAKPSAQELEELGLLKHGMWHGAGTGVVTKPGAFMGEDEMKDPNRGIIPWLNDYFLPALAVKGITKQADVEAELYKALGTETARRLAGLYLQNQDQVLRDATLYNYAKGVDSYKGVAGGDYEANVKNVKDAFDNLMQAAGAPLVPVAIQGVQGLANAMNALAKIAIDHPRIAAIVGEAAGISAGLAVIGGAVVSFAGVVALSRFVMAGKAATVAATVADVAAGTGSATAASGLGGYGTWKAAQQISTVESRGIWSVLGTTGELAGKLAGPISLIMTLRDIGELMNPTTKLGAPYRFDTATPSWREDFERSTRAQKDLHQGADMEAHRGAAYKNMLPPVVNVTDNTKVDVKVTLDGRSIAAAVQSYITKDNRTINSSSGYDGSAGPSYPDMHHD